MTTTFFMSLTALFIVFILAVLNAMVSVTSKGQLDNMMYRHFVLMIAMVMCFLASAISGVMLLLNYFNS